MSRRNLFVPLILACTLPAQAADYSCNFNMECYESDPCAESDFNVEVQDKADQVVTDFGTFPILAQRDLENILTVFIHAEGAVYLLSASDTAARFTAHITEGPQSITYLGQCERIG